MAETSESRDGTGAGDHDVGFSWGHPREYLTLMVQARLTVMRGLVLDVRSAPPSIRDQLRFSGDDDWVEPPPSGIWLARYWGDEEAT